MIDAIWVGQFHRSLLNCENGGLELKSHLSNLTAPAQSLCLCAALSYSPLCPESLSRSVGIETS